MWPKNLAKYCTEYPILSQKNLHHGMIPHHEGALVMANDAIGKSKRPEMQKESKNILNS